MGIRCADHVTPVYPQKLALTSPTDGGRSVGIVRVRTKATEFSLVLDKYSRGAGVVLKISEGPEIRSSRQEAAKSGSVEDMLSDLKATSVQSV